VEIYSRYPSIRLYLNNKLITEKNTTLNEEFKTLIAVPYSAGELKVTGVKDTECYVSDSRKAWHGRAMVVIRSTAKKGKISLQVSGEGLETGEVLLRAVQGSSTPEM
jgi:hypothetical protein